MRTQTTSPIFYFSELKKYACTPTKAKLLLHVCVNATRPLGPLLDHFDPDPIWINIDPDYFV